MSRQPAAHRGRRATVKRTFHQDLVLNRWALNFFNRDSIQTLKARMGDDRDEGLDEDGHTKFFNQLTRNLINIDRINQEELARYDLRIVQYWKEITEGRNRLEGHVLHLKYFQYLSLLFTEIYLDWYFNRRQELLDSLNEELTLFHQEEGQELFQKFTGDDLNKIAFWNATGSGKTLLLHVNIKQYLYYWAKGKEETFPDKIIILTPNEGLSRQHLAEAELSGFGYVTLFEKNNKPLAGTIEIIDVNKLADTMGEKTVAVEAFEGNNLVLVDEGHRGTGKDAEAWMRRRIGLISNGFAFEYSATFGQAVGKGETVSSAEETLRKEKARRKYDVRRLSELEPAQIDAVQLDDDEKRKAKFMATRETYAKCVLFDYSYKFFYEDGYGKEFLILNIREDDDTDKKRSIYFTACLLAFYQQLWLWETKRERLANFNIEKPLWVFVGNKVNDDDSDIRAVIEYLAQFINDRQQIEAWIADLLRDKALILGPKDRNVFEGRFVPLLGRSASEVYIDILSRLFNASAGQRLKLVNLKNAKGELALKIGDAAPFGLINIGDDARFFNDLKADTSVNSFDCENDDFGGGLFGSINNKDSKQNLLIGSRKFTEGWSSWRVSTMGLLNMGTGEGSQIIQLFGRGVRLKGEKFSLRRTAPSSRPKGLFLDKLETLNIFGVRANYMETFKDYLRDEGVTPTDEILQLDFPTRTNLPKRQLKTLGLKDGYKDNQAKGFKRTNFPYLYMIPQGLMDSVTHKPKIKLPHVELDVYPRVEALGSTDNFTASPTKEARNSGKIPADSMRLFNWDRIFLAVQEYKLQRTWSNLRVEKQYLIDFCNEENGWYTLYIPEAELRITKFADIKKHENILIDLLVGYTERFYNALKDAYEGQFYEVIPLTENNGSMLKLYQFEINNSDDGLEYKARIENLQQLVRSGNIGEVNRWNANSMVAICFDRHLYYPLIDLGDTKSLPLKMRPIVFDSPSEVRFVKDLEAFYNSELGKKVIGNYSLYLMRNADSKNKGLGFATASNFYPDFLLWIVDDKREHQWLTFVDPKGIRNISLNHPKLQLHRELQEIGRRLGDTNLTLNSFILSSTSIDDLLNTSMSKDELSERHVILMSDDTSWGYLLDMFNAILRPDGYIA
jgi:hypothetical protein